MPISSTMQHIMIDSNAVVANPELQTATLICDFELYLCRLRMSKSICQCFLPNPVHLVAHHRIEGLLSPDNTKTEADCMIPREFFSVCGQYIRTQQPLDPMVGDEVYRI